MIAPAWRVGLSRRAVNVHVGRGLVPRRSRTGDRVEDLRIESEIKARLVAEKDANLTRFGVLSDNATLEVGPAPR
jgi:hypothetical protein